MASLVSPEVAAAAAQAAVDKLKSENGIKVDAKSGDDSGMLNNEENLKKAAATVFAAAAGKAYVIASHQELLMQKACRHLNDVQFKKLELKLQHFQEMEAILEHERKELELERQAFLLERKNHVENFSIVENVAPPAVPVDLKDSMDIDNADANSKILTLP
jgi:SWI/SNF related-matrix-associated actin-dependent regulator of chromatin subfamily C